MCTATSLLVLVKHTKRAANISELVLIQFELEVWRVCRDKSMETAEAADTRSTAVELLSQSCWRRLAHIAPLRRACPTATRSRDCLPTCLDTHKVLTAHQTCFFKCAPLCSSHSTSHSVSSELGLIGYDDCLTRNRSRVRFSELVSRHSLCSLVGRALAS